MNKFFNFLGLAKRSGNLVEGYSKCDEQRNKVKFHLVILSDDASNSTRKKFKNHCAEKGIPIKRTTRKPNWKRGSKSFSCVR